MSEPALGAFGVVRTGGWAGRLIRVVTDSPVNHAAVYIGNGMVVEAQPEGARMTTMDPNMIWSEAPGDKGEEVAANAVFLIGTPYSWVDVVCIGLAKLLGWDVPESIRHRLNSRGNLMCSQLVDTAYLRAGIHLFNDGRIPGDVSPGDLYDLLPDHIKG